jgi:hypothetical protein
MLTHSEMYQALLDKDVSYEGSFIAAEEKDPDRSTRKKIILEARVLNGEPPDLNF